MLFPELFDTLQNLINFKPSQQNIADILGVRQGAVSNRISRKSPLTFEELHKIENAYKIPGKLTNQFLDIKAQNQIEETLPIDYYPDVFGSCGSGAFVLSDRKEVIQVPKKLFTSFSPIKRYSVINAIGESMSPNIHDKDRLIVEHWEGGQIKDNRVYVFCYMNEIFVKRLVKNIDEIIIQSDNPDPMYRPRHIEKEDMNNVLIVGEIIGLMRDMR